jgi:hypothetical protein
MRDEVRRAREFLARLDAENANEFETGRARIL